MAVCYYSFRLMRSGVAQLVEQVAVNHFVGSSSLSSGAIFLFDDRSNPEPYRLIVRVSDNLPISGILPPGYRIVGSVFDHGSPDLGHSGF